MRHAGPHVEFGAGAEVLLDRVPYVYHGRHDGKLLFLAKVGAATRHLTDTDVFALADQGKLIELEPHETGTSIADVVADREKHFLAYEERYREEARLRDEFIQVLRTAPRGRRSRAAGQKLLDEFSRAKGLAKPPNIRTVQIWAQKDREAKQDPIALVSQAAEHRPRRKRLPEEVQILLDELREEYWLNPQQCTKGEIYSKLRKELKRRRAERPQPG